MGKNFWKFNSSLVQDETFVLKLKEHIKHVKTSFHSNIISILNGNFLNMKYANLQWVILKIKQNSNVQKFHF